MSRVHAPAGERGERVEEVGGGWAAGEARPGRSTCCRERCPGSRPGCEGPAAMTLNSRVHSEAGQKAGTAACMWGKRGSRREGGAACHHEQQAG